MLFSKIVQCEFRLNEEENGKDHGTEWETEVRAATSIGHGAVEQEGDWYCKENQYSILHLTLTSMKPTLFWSVWEDRF